MIRINIVSVQFSAQLRMNKHKIEKNYENKSNLINEKERILTIDDRLYGARAY